MSVQRAMEFAWKYGHFRNPSFPEGRNVDSESWQKLNGKEAEAKGAIQSIQSSDINLEVFCDQCHGRMLSVDGDIGPATERLLEHPRCDVPDYADEGSEYGEAGVGGWLKCDPQSDADHSVRIYMDERRAPAKWQGYLDEVKQNAVDISADVGLSVRYVDSNEDYESSVLFKHIAGGVIGYYYLPGRG